MFPSDPVEKHDCSDAVSVRQYGPCRNGCAARASGFSSALTALCWSSIFFYFLTHGLLQFDFGPSLMSYPEPVTNIIGRNLPYTLGLSLISTLLAWAIGNFIGLLAGFRRISVPPRFWRGIAICIYPIPYFLIALVLQIVFAFVLGWFPIQTTLLTRGTFMQWLGSLLHASILRRSPCCCLEPAGGSSP